MSYISAQKLDFKEPPEPKVPTHIINQIKSFEKGAMKMKPENRKKELAMNEARKKLEAGKLEDNLFGKAKEHARQRRLEMQRKIR